MSRLAVVQDAPVFLDRKQTIDKAVSIVQDVVEAGIELIIFPEAFIPGYPTWVWRLRPGKDMAAAAEIHARLLDNSVKLKTGDLQPLCEVAKLNGVTIVCGINELDEELSRSTIYNTVAVIGPDGSILNRHRKLMPTNPERMIWGFGDASGLRTVGTTCGRIGTLICWENYMPLARYALYAQGIEIYIAPTWDNGDGWIGTLQHIAREGRCWVVGSGTAMIAQDVPASFPHRDELFPDPEEWINAGDSVVVDPSGAIVAGPLRKEKGILFADVDPARVGAARRSLDVAGHYARPDIFQLHVNTTPQRPISFSSEDDPNTKG